MDQNIFLELSKFGILIGAIWALIQFWSANEFKKAQYLSELWRKFYTTDKFVEIFNLLDKEDNELLENDWSSIESKDVFAYLAYLEEIVIFRKTKFYHLYKISDKKLINLFQYHFYNIYFKEIKSGEDTKSRKLFWNKIEESLNTNPSDWKLQLDFAKKCQKSISKN